MINLSCKRQTGKVISVSPCPWVRSTKLQLPAFATLGGPLLWEIPAEKVIAFHEPQRRLRQLHASCLCAFGKTALWPKPRAARQASSRKRKKPPTGSQCSLIFSSFWSIMRLSNAMVPLSSTAAIFQLRKVQLVLYVPHKPEATWMRLTGISLQIHLAYSRVNTTHQVCGPKPQPPPALSAAFFNAQYT